jgi:hypothetical protein
MTHQFWYLHLSGLQSLVILRLKQIQSFNSGYYEQVIPLNYEGINFYVCSLHAKRVLINKSFL